MLKEAIEKIEQLTTRGEELQHLHETAMVKVFGCDSGHVAFVKEPPTRFHVFNTVEGFLSYLHAYGVCDPPNPMLPELAKIHDYTASGIPVPQGAGGIVFVEPYRVVSQLRYPSYYPDIIRLNLLNSEEFGAFKQLCSKPRPQKTVRDLLISDLAGSIRGVNGEDLEIVLATIQMTSKGHGIVDIDQSGLVQTEGSQQQEVMVITKEGKRCPLPLHWMWTGRIWECFEQEYDINFRLDLIQDEKNVFFNFLPRRQFTVLRTARMDLVERLRKQTPKNFTVHEGELNESEPTF